MRRSAVCLDWGGTGGIRAFKFMGPKPSATRRANTRTAQKRISANLDALRSVAPKPPPPPAGVRGLRAAARPHRAVHAAQ